MVTQKIEHPDDYEAVKRLFDPQMIEAETELTPLQIERVNKLQTLGLILGQPLLKVHLQQFMILQKSKERKGLGEYVEAMKNKKEEINIKMQEQKKRFLG